MEQDGKQGKINYSSTINFFFSTFKIRIITVTVRLHAKLEIILLFQMLDSITLSMVMPIHSSKKEDIYLFQIPFISTSML